MSPAIPTVACYTHTHTHTISHRYRFLSVITSTPADRRRSLDPLTVTAVNLTSQIHTYRKHSLTFNLVLRRSLPWIFVIADVKKSILGANFLRHFVLKVGMNHHKIVDTGTHVYIQGPESYPLTLHSVCPCICPKLLPNSIVSFPPSPTSLRLIYL